MSSHSESSQHDQQTGSGTDENPVTDEQYGVLKTENDPRPKEEIISTIARRHPIELEERIDTLGKPLIIECASPGWQPDEWPPEDAYPEGLPPNYTEPGDTRYPAVPCSLEAQADEIVKAAKAGCAAAHIHPRDPADCLGTDDVDMLADIYRRIFEETDVVSVQHSWKITPDNSIDYIDMAEQKLAAAGGSNKYIQGSVMLWPPFDSYPKKYTERMREGVEFYREHGIKPIHKVRSSYNTRRLYRDLNATGLLDDGDGPLCVFHDMGHPFGWPLDQDPWMPIEMITSLEQTKQRFPDDTVIGVCSGGRNWLPITIEAILRGVDYVRVGIEDYYWMYPHRDEVIQENIEVVNKIVDFCNIIGREVATPAQARDIMGIELT
ncbi:3-keto-5-aminohexanoate cleavage protein [Haloferax namakaokahaiae]|uniref:3-keto-5-aminohexanoate cleavage protein n=1 Tax=Haloferax namakaokahaiae TaxID=1748331 RepID=A0ABD5ZDI4_9EURY